MSDSGTPRQPDSPPPQDADPRPAPSRPVSSRRDFLRGAALSSLIGGLGCRREAEAQAADATATAAAPLVSGAVTAELTVNGKPLAVVVEPRTTLLDALRDGRSPGGQPVDHTGAKRVCDRGTCGACTVLLDGAPVYACTVLALEAEGRDIRTVEGLGSPENLHVLQQAFVEHDALMCGYCTPGFVMAAAALLEANPRPERREIQQALDGNICRCGTYNRIFEAVESAAATLRGEA